MKARSSHRTPRTEARMRIVVAVLTRYGGRVFPKQTTLAKACKMTKSTLVRMLDELKKEGVLKTEQRGPTSCLYLLQDKCEMDKAMEKPMAKALAKALPPHLFTESSESSKKQAARASFEKLELPPLMITTPGGRRIENPERLRVNGILRNARDRIRRANDPVAYEQAILREALGFASRSHNRGGKPDSGEAATVPGCGPLAGQAMVPGDTSHNEHPDHSRRASTEASGPPQDAGVGVDADTQRSDRSSDRHCRSWAAATIAGSEPARQHSDTPRKPPDSETWDHQAFLGQIEALAARKSLARAP